MPERQSVEQRDFKKEIITGRIFTMQIAKSLLLVYQLAASETGSTVKVIAEKEGEEYPIRKRLIRVATGEDRFPKFYIWQVATNTVRKNNIAIVIGNPKGEEGFTKFWLRVSARGQRAPRTPAKVVKTPVSQ